MLIYRYIKYCHMTLLVVSGFHLPSWKKLLFICIIIFVFIEVLIVEFNSVVYDLIWQKIKKPSGNIIQ